MNSDDEARLLESYGWERDYVKRIWVAPDGYVLSLDVLVAAMENFGEQAEWALRSLAREHGEEKH